MRRPWTTKLTGWLAKAGIAVLVPLLAACNPNPTVEFTTTIPVGPNVTLSLTAASGFRGTVEFRCRGWTPIFVTIIGNETSITLISGGQTLLLEGGPYRYEGGGQTVTFEPGYNELEWQNASGRKSCRG